MKGKSVFIVAVVLALATGIWAQSFGIRGAIGQFASQAEQIDGRTGNSFLLGVNFEPKGAFRIDVGLRFNGVSETDVDIPLSEEEVSFLDIKNVRMKIGYTGLYVAPGVNINLSAVGTGVKGYLYAGGGLAFSTIATKVEFADTAAVPVYHLKYEESRDYWKPLWLLGAGVKVQVFYFGVFGEATYYDGEELAYDGMSVSGTEIVPPGEIAPRGFAAYIGVCWN